MRDNKAPVRNPVVALREEFDEWAVLFNPDTAEAAGINPVGVAIWKELDGKHRIDEIADAIRHQFEDAPQPVESDIQEFVDELVERGFAGYELEAFRDE